MTLAYNAMEHETEAGSCVDSGLCVGADDEGILTDQHGPIEAGRGSRRRNAVMSGSGRARAVACYAMDLETKPIVGVSVVGHDLDGLHYKPLFGRRDENGGPRTENSMNGSGMEKCTYTLGALVSVKGKSDPNVGTPSS